MALGVCLLFDRETERALTALWRRVEADGVPTLRSHTHGRHVPHLSYVVLLDWDLDNVRAAVEELADSGPCELTFDAVASFPRGRVSLVPAPPAGLLTRQQAVLEAVRTTGALVHKHYETDAWLPHSSVATRARLDQLADVASRVYDILPLRARVTRAALIDSGTGRRWPLSILP